MSVSTAREVEWFGKIAGTSFATLGLYDCHFMPPTAQSVTKVLAASELDHTLVPSGTVYFRNLRPDTVRHRVAPRTNSQSSPMP